MDGKRLAKEQRCELRLMRFVGIRARDWVERDFGRHRRLEIWVVIAPGVTCAGCVGEQCWLEPLHLHEDPSDDPFAPERGGGAQGSAQARHTVEGTYQV